MKTADLRKYRKNIEALEAIDRLLNERCFVADTVQGSHGAPDYAQTHRHIEGYKRGKATSALLAEKKKIEAEQRTIKMYIDGIRDRRIYQALYLYCIEGLPTWETVAQAMNEESSKALEMAVNRFFCEN